MVSTTQYRRLASACCLAALGLLSLDPAVSSAFSGVAPLEFVEHGDALGPQQHQQQLSEQEADEETMHSLMQISRPGAAVACGGTPQQHLRPSGLARYIIALLFFLSASLMSVQAFPRLPVAAASGGGAANSNRMAHRTTQLRRLDPPKNTGKQRLGTESGSSTSDQELSKAASELKVAALRRRAAKTAYGEDEIFEDDLDTAAVELELARAEVSVRHRRYERARKHLKEGVRRALQLLRDLETDGGEAVKLPQIARARKSTMQALTQLGGFYLERGHAAMAVKVLERARMVTKDHAVDVAGEEEEVAIKSLRSLGFRAEMLLGNAYRDQGQTSEAKDTYSRSISELGLALQQLKKRQGGKHDDDMIEAGEIQETLSLTQGELGRLMLRSGDVEGAKEAFAKAQEYAEGSLLPEERRPQLLARLSGWLGKALQEEGRYGAALARYAVYLEDLDRRGDQGSGQIAEDQAAVVEGFEVMQNTALAWSAEGDWIQAWKVLAAVQSMQDEIWDDVRSERNPNFFAADTHARTDDHPAAAHQEGGSDLKEKENDGGDSTSSGLAEPAPFMLPDPRLRASMARTKLVGSELNLRGEMRNPEKAVRWAEDALKLLRETAPADRTPEWLPGGASMEEAMRAYGAALAAAGRSEDANLVFGKEQEVHGKNAKGDFQQKDVTALDANQEQEGRNNKKGAAADSDVLEAVDDASDGELGDNMLET